ncbi:sensor domain-containing diguanylate cyclase [Sulfurimonas sp. HSL-3221]|uniref:sensor domain-containing diguanylate cyclase n=1 Tax=Sulfurimonadaceae TaxID=2771471 RepID=UPI001E4865A0|nr:sensor domain-containing diguanylate cyclase [Sulfurimonas sp. HSL-3221]UFS61379.1 sensor domain-containing diguanylate cyclase [Sulfurimonas sp. HSL-3221]
MKRQVPASRTSDYRSDTLAMEQMRVLYSHLPSSLAVSAMLALILVMLQAPVIAPGVRYGWLALLCAVLLSRVGLLFAWRRAGGTISPADADRWLLRFRFTLIVTGIVWGIGGVLLVPADSISHQVYVAFTLAGLSAGSATVLAIDRKSVVGFILPVLLSLIVPLVAADDTDSLGMGVMLSLFLLFLVISARQTGLRLEENFHLRVKAVQNEARLLRMLESSPIATRIADLVSNSVVFANSRYNALLELPAEEVIGIQPSRYYAHPEELSDIDAIVTKGEKVVDRLIELRSPGSSPWTKWVLASYFPMEYHGKPAVLGWFYDITDRKLEEDEVEHEAFHDMLTGLPNRLHFHNQIHKAIAGAERKGTDLALMFIDLDKFKPVNDRFGHDIGDMLLKAVAGRLVDCLRQTDIAARIGGDEFVVLLSDVGGEHNAVAIGEKIRHALAMPFKIVGQMINISSSIGVAIYPKDAAQEDELIKRADIAMYNAKAKGRNSVVTYKPGMQGEGD